VSGSHGEKIEDIEEGQTGFRDTKAPGNAASILLKPPPVLWGRGVKKGPAGTTCPLRVPRGVGGRLGF